MIPSFDKIHNRFRINGSSYSREELREVAYSHVKEGLEYEKAIGDFLIDWLNDKDHVIVSTSGSTGQPKKIKLNKQAMVHSAIATGDFFGLKPGDTALHCLPTQYIAGKMMLVRAMILGMDIDLTEPTSQPIFDYDRTYDFCAMIPLQLQKTKLYCGNIKTIIVGGASVSSNLKDAIQGISSMVYETYGMTETMTHIALKKLNGFYNERQESNSYFRTLPNIKVSQDDRDCLIIIAPYLSKTNFITNDLVKLYSENEFEWLGRYDNIINSGGVKLIPEQIELALSESILQRFFISKETDESLGERVILIVEGKKSGLNPKAFEGLNKYQIPKAVYFIDAFSESENGKVLRQETLDRISK